MLKSEVFEAAALANNFCVILVTCCGCFALYVVKSAGVSFKIRSEAPAINSLELRPLDAFSVFDAEVFAN